MQVHDVAKAGVDRHMHLSTGAINREQNVVRAPPHRAGQGREPAGAQNWEKLRGGQRRTCIRAIDVSGLRARRSGCGQGEQQNSDADNKLPFHPTPPRRSTIAN
jgi:hypothetical protein